MSTNFFFKSIKVENYRALHHLNIESLRRVNLIGGLNGTGKSTLLDALFLFLDRRGPIGLIRPYMTRGVQPSFPGGLDYLFGQEGKDVPIQILTTTKAGEINLVMNRGKPDVPINLAAGNNPNFPIQGAPTTSDPNQIGIHSRTTFNGKEDDISFTMQSSQEGLSFTMVRNGQSPMVPGAFIGSGSKVTPLEDAQRFSLLVKEGRIKEVVSALQFVLPDLNNFQLLQEGAQPSLYATMKDGKMLHTNMLGGGFQSVLSVALLLMVTRDGVILFDEVDSSIHYSKLTFFWDLIGRLAEQQNCQVFAVTHSRECIAHAITGFSERKRLSDLQYIRLENDDNETDCISYTGEELASAIELNWEIR